jgi:hypothetical protein
VTSFPINSKEIFSYSRTLPLLKKMFHFIGLAKGSNGREPACKCEALSSSSVYINNLEIIYVII